MKVTLNCQQCGKSYEVHQCYATKSKYCSRQCFVASQKNYDLLTCHQCDKEYEANPAQRGKYCSRQCYKNAMPKRVSVTCQQCGKKDEVMPSEARHKYCSRQCYKLSMLKQVSAICHECGKEYVPSEIKRKYCSQQCASNAQKQRVLCICSECGKEYETIPSDAKRKYCSQQCHENVRAKRVSLTCKQCGKEYVRKPYAAARSKYCSKQCVDKAMPDIMRIRWQDDGYASKLMAGWSRSPNRPETLINNLTPDSVTYTGDGSFWRRLPTGKSSNPDFIVNPIYKDGKIIKSKTKQVIFFHGIYWHRDELHNRGQDLIDAYAEIGYDCLIIWEDQLDTAIEKIAAFIALPDWQLNLF